MAAAFSVRAPVRVSQQRLRHAVAAARRGQVRTLSGGRSATTLQIGKGSHALVFKITRLPTHAAAKAATAIAEIGRRRPVPRLRWCAWASGGSPHGTICGLFEIDPLLEPQVMAALARRGLAAPPAAAFRQGANFCLVYPFAPGRTGQPPGPALARLLRRLHDLPTAALPRLRGSPDGHDALLALAIRRLEGEPDGRALCARVAAARRAARAPLPKGRVPLHGDPAPGNVVAGRHGLLLIDWHSAHSGDPCHDIAVALSPAMQVINGLPACSVAQRAAFLAAYGCPSTAARHAATEALRHGLMIGHCLWRLESGDAAYGPALAAELAALRALPDP